MTRSCALLSLIAGLTSATSGWWASATPADDLPFYAALHTRQAPTVDGGLDEACWQTAEMTRPFVAIGGAAVDVATQALACWDREHLYVAFICPEPRMKDLEDRIARADVGRFDESVELFLDAAGDRYSYVQLRVDILGNRDTHRRADLGDSLTPQWAGAVQRGVDAWTVEIAVPFAMLEAAQPGPATLWNWNVNRQRLAHGGPVQWTCWSDTKGGFHSPDRFGRLIFSDFRAWLRFHIRAQVEAVEAEMGDLVSRYPQAADSFLRQIEHLDRLQSEFLEALPEGRVELDSHRAAAYARGLILEASFSAALDEMRLTVLRDVLR